MNTNRTAAGRAAYVFLSIAVGTIVSILVSTFITSEGLFPGVRYYWAEICGTGLMAVAVIFLVTAPALGLSFLFGLIHLVIRTASKDNKITHSANGSGTTLNATSSPVTVRHRLKVGMFILLGATAIIWGILVTAAIVTGDGVFFGYPDLSKNYGNGLLDFVSMALLAAYATLSGAAALGMILLRKRV